MRSTSRADRGQRLGRERVVDPVTSCSMIGPSSSSAVTKCAVAPTSFTHGRGLVVGPGALEARKERMVDVDGTPAEERAHLVAQHLHVARQHDEIDPMLVHEVAQGRLLRRLGRRGDREVHVGGSRGRRPAARSRGGLDTTSGMSTASSRCATGTVRSTRQWSWRDTISRTRGRWPAGRTWTVAAGSPRWAPMVRCRTVESATSASHSIRMQNVPVSGSLNWRSRRCWRRARAAPSTRRGRSRAGHDRSG